MVSVQENVSLRPYNTFDFEASARFFVEIHSLDDLRAVLQNPTLQSLPRLLLGGGSNVLLTGDFEGLVLKISIPGIDVVRENEAHVWLKVGAGEGWHDLVRYALAHNFAGLENLSLIP
ncbi:MAG: FAD-binding protein, partial [Sphingobacteriaceae bacterium]|nr:FAD-binding protein [Cytophagaceae bacterium]